MKRILILIKGLGRGGAEQLLVSAAKYVDRTRFDYEVAYVLPYKNALVPELEAAGLQVTCMDGARNSRWVHRLRDLVRQRGIDLVHAHSPLPAVAARLALARPRPRLVYTEHNGWERFHRATYWANLLTFGRNDHVFAVSDQVRRSVHYPAGLRGLRMPPVKTLYHGIDPAAFQNPPSPDGARAELGVADDAPVVGMVANFKAHKGHSTLLDAAVLVRRALPDVRFLLVGVGPLEGPTRRRARELGLNGTIVFTGFRSDVPRLAATFDIFALPSNNEGLSIALLEAMALGKPAVVSNVGGLPEVVTHGRNGLVVPPHDPAALAEGIVSLLRDGRQRSRLGREARRRASDFDIRRAVREMETVYEDLLG